MLIAALTIVVYGNYALLAFECSATQDPVTPTLFIFSNRVTSIMTVKYGLQRKLITAYFKDSRDPLTNLFLTAVGKIFFLTLLVCVHIKMANTL
jgi:hypothetical protein